MKTKVSELGRTSECGDHRGFHIPQLQDLHQPCDSRYRRGKNSRDRAKQVKICEGN